MPTTLTPDQIQLAQILQNYGMNPSSLATSGGYDSGGGQNQIMGIPTASLDSATGIGTGLANAAVPGAGAIGQFAEGNTTAGILSLLSGGFSDLLGGLFGSKKKASWQPYINEQGQYVWTDPKSANPIPLSGIPGSSMAPTAEYTAMADQVRAIQDLLPYFSQAISQQKIPDAMGQLAADTATTGPRLALQQALQEQYGPIFDQLNAESNLRKSMSNASNDANVLAGPGKELIARALEAAKLADPEYYNTRAQTGNSLAALLGQTTANLGSGLSATEADEVGRGLALSNERAGTAGAPSQLNTVQNAMQFGAAGRARETENQNQLSKAIAASTAFLPASKSGVDVFQVATGRPSYANNDNRFDTNTATNDASGNANSLLNTGTSMWNTNANIKATADLNEEDWADQLSKITGSLGAVGGLIGMCWIAREVYGAENPKWLIFRQWLCKKAPRWFYYWYRDNGEQFAKFISNKPLLKYFIRLWMNRKINQYVKA